MNALVGEKVAITSSKPQTTRRAIRGIVHRPDGQLIIVDTPGMHRPRTLLGERLNDVVTTTLATSTSIGFCVPADEQIGPGDRYINEQLDARPAREEGSRSSRRSTRRRGRRSRSSCSPSATSATGTAIMPVSAQDGIQLDVLADEALALMPESPRSTRRGGHRRVARAADRRAHPRGRARGRPRRAAALARRHDRRHEEREDATSSTSTRTCGSSATASRIIMIGHGGARLKQVGAARARRDRAAGRHAGVPLPAREGREGVAARPRAAGPARLLIDPAILGDRFDSSVQGERSVTSGVLMGPWPDDAAAATVVR